MGIAAIGLAARSCYNAPMPRDRTQWRADQGARALKRIRAIEVSIKALPDEDLLDLADIFGGSNTTPLGAIACGEMKRRNIAL